MGLQVDNGLDFEQIATPGAPAAGITRLYAKSGGGVYVQSSVAAEAQMLPGPINTGARAYRNGALSFSANVWTKIPIDTVLPGGDPGGHMDVTTNHRYNVTAPGQYQVNGQIEIAPNATNVSLYISAAIYKNGAIYSQGNAASNTGSGIYASANVTDVIPCVSGDYLELWAISPGWSLQTGAVVNYLSVFRIP